MFLLKNTNGQKIIYLSLNQISLSKVGTDDRGEMTLKGSIEVDYLNRRKQAMEPLLELWPFKLSQTTTVKDGKEISELELTDVENQKYKDLNNIKNYCNSLNINITVPLIETAFEALRIFKQPRTKDVKPYIFYNYTGQFLEVLPESALSSDKLILFPEKYRYVDLPQHNPSSVEKK